MSTIEVKFLHPTDSLKVMTADVDGNLTAAEAIGALLDNDFIAYHESGYELVAGNEVLRQNQTFAAAGIEHGSVIRIFRITAGGGGRGKYPATDVQGNPDDRDIHGNPPLDIHGNPRKGIPGLNKATIQEFSIEQIRNSPEAMVMIVHLYDELQSKYEGVSTELEKEKLKSRDRFVATLLLLVSQVILSIGGNLLTSNNTVAIPVFIVGGLQAGLALYLTFRRPKLDS